MKVLVTGSAGFVGRHFLQKLEGHDITAIDIKDGIDARDFFKKDNTRFDLVIHLAALVGGRATIEGQPLHVASDLAIDSDMFQWALRTRPHRLVYFSSSAAYPTMYQTRACYRPLSEGLINLDNVSSPDYTYGWVKLTGEYLAKFAQAEGVRVSVFRPFSGYGSDQDLDYPYPSFIARGLSRSTPFKVWGDGEQVRDFIHIDDIVDAVMTALENDVQGPTNLGWGRPTSFNELASAVMDACGYHAPLDHIEAAPVGVHYRVADPTKMFTFYTPKITLEEGIWRSVLEARGCN